MLSASLPSEFQITDLLKERGGEMFWTGLTDVAEEGIFVWESGRPLSLGIESHWGSSQPGIRINFSLVV